MKEELYCIVRSGGGKDAARTKLCKPGNVYLWDNNDGLGYLLEEAKETLRNIAAYDNTYYDDDDFETIVKAYAEDQEITTGEARKSATWYKGAGYYDNECNLVYREGETSYSEDGVTYSIEDHLISLKVKLGAYGFETKEDFAKAALGGVATTNGDPFALEEDAYEDFKLELVRAFCIEKLTPEDDDFDEYEWESATRRLDFENPADVTAIYIVQGYDPSDKMLVCLDDDNLLW
jgi:hypothetical protein